jgi:hypothetical protein
MQDDEAFVFYQKMLDSGISENTLSLTLTKNQVLTGKLISIKVSLGTYCHTYRPSPFGRSFRDENGADSSSQC